MMRWIDAAGAVNPTSADPQPDAASAELDAITAAATTDGRIVQVVNAGATKRASLDEFAATLDFPEWFGRNLDALADCLDSWVQAQHTGTDIDLIWDHTQALRARDDGAAQGIESVLRDVEADHHHLHVTVVNR